MSDAEGGTPFPHEEMILPDMQKLNHFLGARSTTILKSYDRLFWSQNLYNVVPYDFDRLRDIPPSGINQMASNIKNSPIRCYQTHIVQEKVLELPSLTAETRSRLGLQEDSLHNALASILLERHICVNLADENSTLTSKDGYCRLRCYIDDLQANTVDLDTSMYLWNASKTRGQKFEYLSRQIISCLEFLTIRNVIDTIRRYSLPGTPINVLFHPDSGFEIRSPRDTNPLDSIFKPDLTHDTIEYRPSLARSLAHFGKRQLLYRCEQYESYNMISYTLTPPSAAPQSPAGFPSQ